MAKVNLKNKNRMLFAFGAMALLMALLIVRVAWIQIVNGEEEPIPAFCCDRSRGDEVYGK